MPGIIWYFKVERDIQLTASENLTAKIDGVGDIYYKGTPRISKAISGVGKLINTN